jgi:hypothetical protein
MAEFNYNEYIKNNPLLQEEVKEQLLIESQEVSEGTPSKKTTVSALKNEIKEMILASLNEADDPVIPDDEEGDGIEGEMDADPEMDLASRPEAGLSQDELEIQNALKLAYDNALAIGDQKLADQIGNSITFFTRTHVVER